MKKYINLPRTEEVRQLESEQEVVEMQQTKEEKSASSSVESWEKWGFSKKRKEVDVYSEETKQKGEPSNSKKQEIEYIISGKSDIIISFDEQWMSYIVNKEKNYEFRKWKTDSETRRMWIYINKPTAQLKYIIEIDQPVVYPNQISEDGLGNKEFNQAADDYKGYNFAYRIKHLYELNSPIDSKTMKSKYNIHPPQKFTYVSKYPGLVKDIIIKEQKKLY